jgi:hypothetical protein
MTYHRRLRADVAAAIATQDGEDFFDKDFIEKVSSNITRQEELLSKLIALQLSILGFLVIGFVSPDAKASLFGI